MTRSRQKLEGSFNEEKHHSEWVSCFVFFYHFGPEVKSQSAPCKASKPPVEKPAVLLAWRSRGQGLKQPQPQSEEGNRKEPESRFTNSVYKLCSNLCWPLNRAYTAKAKRTELKFELLPAMGETVLQVSSAKLTACLKTMINYFHWNITESRVSIIHCKLYTNCNVWDRIQNYSIHK